MRQIRLLACVVIITLAVWPLPASAWNIPGHMLSGAIANQVLQQENPQTIDKVKAVLEKHPWHANQWQARLQDVAVADHASSCLCRRPDGLTIFAPTTSSSTVRCGTTSIGPLSGKDIPGWRINPRPERSSGALELGGERRQLRFILHATKEENMYTRMLVPLDGSE